MDQSSEVVVIGGGIAGLATAALVAREGLAVRVLEKAGAFGGRAATQQRDGFSLNLGPHALYRGGRGIAILRALGIEPRGGVPPTAGTLGFVGDQAHALPTGVGSLLGTGLLGVSAKLGVARVLSWLARMDVAPWQGKSVSAWLDAVARAPDLRAFVAALLRVATYAGDPDRQSAGSAVEQLRLATRHGVVYLDGGWATLVDGLRLAAEAAGAHLVAGARALRVDRAPDGRAEAVCLDDGRRIAASAVVLAGSPAMAAALLPTSPELARFAREAIPVRASCLDLGLSRLPRPRAIFGLGIDRPLYVSVHSASARLAPDGCALIQAARYGDGEGDGEGDAEAELEALVERLQPGFREHVVTRRFLPRMVVSNALVTAAQGGLAGRPDPRVPGCCNAFLAGDWVGSEGQLADASLASAAQVAGILGEARAPRKAA